MIVIWECKQSIETYAEKGKNDEFPKMEKCPRCKAKTRLKRHGFYERNAVEEEKVYRLQVCRLKCDSCQKTVSLLPDFLLPFFQHTLHTVMNRVKEKLEGKPRKENRQLIQFYYQRFISQLKNIEMFFRDQNWRGKIPLNTQKKAIKLLEMIRSFGEAVFVRRSQGHFTHNFMGTFIVP